MQIYPVNHGMGLSLVKAETPEMALDKARKCFGSFASPYRIGSDDDKAWASGMGARVIE